MRLLHWLAALAVALMLVIPAHTAHARPSDGFGPDGHRVPTPGGTAEMGQYHLGDVVVYCIDLNSVGPHNASGWVSETPGAVRMQIGYGGERGDPTELRGPVIDDRIWAEIAWLLDHARSRRGADWAAAVDHLIRTRTAGDRAQHDRVAERYAATVERHPAVAEHVGELEGLIAEQAGPYRLDLAWVTEPTLDHPGTARVRVLGAAGTAVPVPVAVEVDGQPMTAVVENGEHRVEVSAGAGERTVTARAEVPADRPVLHRATHHALANHPDSSVQRMVGAAPRRELAGNLTATVVPRLPTVSTTTSATEIEPGTELSDHVTVGDIDPGEQQATAILYGPYPAPPVEEQCRPEDEFGRVSFPVTGVGAVTTPALTPTEPGWYTWVVELDESPTQQAHRTSCGIPEETTLVIEPVEAVEPAPPLVSTEPTPVPRAAAPASPSEDGDRLRIRAGGLPPMVTGAGALVAGSAAVLFVGALAGEFWQRRRRR